MSRRFASILILSNRPSGRRNEIVCVEGFRLGKRTGSARPQSTYAVDSCVSQNSRSSASVLNSETPFLGRTASGPPSEIPRFLEVCAVINDSLIKFTGGTLTITPQGSDDSTP